MVEEKIRKVNRPLYTIPLTYFPKWQRVLNHAGNNFECYEAVYEEEFTNKMAIVLKAHNALKDFCYISDADYDHWKTPDESLQDSGGDCEDYAILAMHYLCYQGFRKDDMELVIGHTAEGIIHAVTRVWPTEDINYALLFDVRVPHVRDEKISLYKTFWPIFALNFTGGRICQK